MKKLILLLMLIMPFNIKACYESVSITGIHNRVNGHQGTCRVAGSYSGTASGPCASGTCGNSNVAAIGDSGGKLCFYAKGFGTTTCHITISASCMCSGVEYSRDIYVELAEWGFQNISIENYNLNKKFADATHEYKVTVDSDTITVIAVKNDTQTTIKTSPQPKSTEIVSNTTVKYTFSGLKVGENKITLASVSRFGTSIPARDNYIFVVTRNKPKDVESISLNKTDIKLHQKGIAVLEYSVKPDNADTSNLIWSTSDSKVATVTNGIVAAVAPGKATITASVNGKSAMVNVIVLTDVNSVVFDNELVNLAVGETKYLSYKVYPEDATNKNVIFESSNPDVASIDEFGNVRALKAGKTIIEVTTEDGEFFSECLVIVTKKVDSINITPTKVKLNRNQNIYLTPTILPSDATNQTITWKSSNESVAFVNDRGVVIADSPGKTIVTAQIDGIISNEVEVTVEDSKKVENKTQSNTIIYVAIIIVIIAIVFIGLKFKSNKEEY